MDDSDLPGACPHGLLPPDSVDSEAAMSEDNGTGNSMEEIPGDENPSSQTFIAETTNFQSNTSEDIKAEKGTSACTAGRERGRHGMKWVQKYWDIKERLKKENNGTMPYVEAFRTSSFPNSDKWSKDDLPEILLYLKPPKSKYAGQPVGLLKEDGKVVKVGGHGKPLRDFPILPRHISVDVEGWLVEAWRRIDPRITYPDILDRQTEDLDKGIKKLDKNALQNRCRRECRTVLGNWTSYERRDDPHRADVEAIEKLSYQNIMLNTVLDVCPVRQDRLTKVRITTRSKDGNGKLVAEPCEVNAMNLYETTFPIDHFVLKSEVPTDGLHSMDNSMMAAWELCLILQERARLHKVSEWGKLRDCCRPVSWYDRTANKRVANGTFDGGCPVCTWIPGRDQVLHKEWVDEIRSACSKPANRKAAAKSDSSSGTSKRRKLKNGKSQDVSVDTGEESNNECVCCKEAESPYELGLTNGQRPSEPFRLGEIKSYFRDPDRIEEAQFDNSAGKFGGHIVIDKEGGHNVIEQKTKYSVEPGTGDGGPVEDRELQVSTSIYTRPATPQMSDRELSFVAYPERENIDFTRSGISGTEKDLNGIGSHFIVGRGGYPPKRMQDEAAAGMAVEEMDVEHNIWNWPVTKVPPLPEDFGANWSQDDDPEALWRAGAGISPVVGDDQVDAFTLLGASTFRAEDSVGATKESKASTIENAIWPDLSEHHAANSYVDGGPRLYLHSDPQAYSSRSGGQNTFQQGMERLWPPSQPSTTEQYGLDQGWASGHLSVMPPSMYWENTPELTNSFRTESNASGSELAGSATLPRNNDARSGGVDEPVNFGGFSSVNDATSTPYSQNVVEEALRAEDAAFNMDAVFDTASFQNRLELSDDPATSYLSSGTMSKGNGKFNEFPAESFYGYDVLNDGLSAIDESAYKLF